MGSVLMAGENVADVEFALRKWGLNGRMSDRRSQSSESMSPQECFSANRRDAMNCRRRLGHYGVP